MLEPRVNAVWMKTHPYIKYLGGVADFDLWYRELISGSRLRVVTMDGTWDHFRLPLHLNEEHNADMEPAARRIAGAWNDIHLTLEQFNEIETYLQCFAPWTLAEEG